MKALLLAAIAALAVAHAVAAEGPAGNWSGEWVRDGSALAVEMTFTRTATGYEGSFSSRALRVSGIPLARIDYDPPRIRWDVVGDETTSHFEGTLDGGAMSGRFSDGKGAGTFAFSRTSAPSAPIAATDITFANGAVTLSGTLVSPAGAGPFPAIVMVHGSGAEGRYASRFLAEEFARRGIAALIYDKRGVGKSGGDWRTADFRTLAADASAAVDALRSRSDIDPAKVGIHGHSQGATIAPLIAATNPHVAFVVASAGAGISMAEGETYSLENFYKLAELPPDERALARHYIQTVVAVAYEGLPYAELERERDRVQGHAWALRPPAQSDQFWAVSRANAAYDPLEQWRRVRAPALLVYGERDERVPARRSSSRIAQAYLGAQGSRLDVMIFPLADHTLRITPGGGKFEWPKNAPGYPDRLIDWLLAVTR